jgi:hypothetical protein
MGDLAQWLAIIVLTIAVWARGRQVDLLSESVRELMRRELNRVRGRDAA